MKHTITIELVAVADGDATDLAQRIWDENADEFDASQGDFQVSVSRDGFPLDWSPEN